MEKSKRINWDEYFMAQAKLIATRSTCPKLSVGCVLTRNNHVISTGFNGSISKDKHCIEEGCLEVDGHCIRTVHAEVNAVTQCAKQGIETEGAIAYITHFPCLNCVKVLLSSGVREIIYETSYKVDSYILDLLYRFDIQLKQVQISPQEILKYLEQ